MDRFNDTKRAFALLVVLALLATGSAMADDRLPGNTDTVTGTVLETFNAGGYTYLRLALQDSTYWVAGPQTKLTPNQAVTVTPGFLMADFYSKALDRTFPEIYFVGSIEGTDPLPGETHMGSDSGTNLILDKIEVDSVPLAAGGMTIGDILANRLQLKGTKVKVRAVVVKSSGSILDRNWFHIQDGTGFEGQFDLTITSPDTVSLGDNIVVEGVLSLDRDFGAGYLYPTIIEDAHVTIK